MKIIIEKDAPIPLRDGVVTLADIYRPESAAKVPTLVSRTPYGKAANQGIALMPDPLRLAELGYATAIVDVRGRFGSQGDWNPFQHEADDGYDTVEWVAAQDWCNGRTGIFGISYFGATAILAAGRRPPSLRCAVPILTSADYYEGWIYQGGCLQLGFAANWGLMLAAGDPARQSPEAMGALVGAIVTPGTLDARPLAAMPGLSGTSVEGWWKDWITHERRDAFWEQTRPSADYARFEVPMLHVGGWYDLFGGGTVNNFQGMSAAAHSPQYLVMGPWGHGSFDRSIGEVDFGLFSHPLFFGLPDFYQGFFDRYLKDKPFEKPAVSYFLMGANEWRNAETWPPANTMTLIWYLHSQGAANTSKGDGTLDEAQPSSFEAADAFTYDPANPVPTNGGPIFHGLAGGTKNLPGPRDQSGIELREDVLCYTSVPLDTPLVIAGPVTMSLWASTDAPDTDWTAKLLYVLPDGRSFPLCEGILRASCREGLDRKSAVTANTPLLYEIDLTNTAYRFEKGQRIRVDISSSNAPRFRPNPNTDEALASATASRAAYQRIHHDAEHPSCIKLSVLTE